jgi:hypothetical protein
LRRELTACLRTGRVLRMPRARTRGRGKTFISPEIMISQRPAEAADRAVPGHWEGDLILGLGSSAIGTLVERMTRFTLLLHLPRMTDHGHEARVKNGPALAGHGAEAVCDAITRTMITLPEQLRRSLTWDQGAEMAQHARLKIDAGIQVYFCDPHSPWQRGTNENTNGLLRQYFPKGTDLSMHSADDIAAVAAALNTRPRKTLAWQTPAEALDQLLISAMSSDVRNLLRVFGRLPVSGVTRCSEAGVRKASGEETAGGVCAGSGVGLWRFSLCMPRSLDIERGSRPSNHRGVGFWSPRAGSERWSCSERSLFWRSTAGLTVAIGGGQASPMRHRRETGAAMWDGGRSVLVMSCRR